MTDKLTRLTRLARTLRIAATSGAVVVPLLTAAAISGPLTGSETGSVTATLEGQGLPWGVASAIASGVALLIVCALLSLRRMLTDVAMGNLFSPLVTTRFRRFAMWLVAACLTSVVLPAAAQLVIGLGHAPHAIPISLDARDVLLLFLSVLLVLVARLFETAAHYREDSLSII